MRYSSFYAPTKKSAAKTDSINAYLLDKAGYVTQVAAGVYNFLPLGLRVLNRIEQVVREEMNSIGGNEVVMAALQPQQTWEQSGRWQDKNFRQIIYFDADSHMTFGATHEEPMAIAVKEAVRSYRDLPIVLYQFQTKFRKELRAKSGLLRGREFRMKDLYSFHPDEKTHNKFYEECARAYLKAFHRLGLDAYRVKAAGGIFTDKVTDEFQVISSTGEDEILVNHRSKTGYNREIEDKIPDGEKASLERVQGIEVGNIFHYGTRYTDAFDVKYLDRAGKQQSVFMGAYGIGISRLVGTLAELFNDEHGLKWPSAVSPFDIYFIDLTESSAGEKLVQRLEKAGYQVLFDDREEAAGAKFVEADLLGFPIRVVYSQKTAQEGKVEVKLRSDGTIKLLPTEELINFIGKN